MSQIGKPFQVLSWKCLEPHKIERPIGGMPEIENASPWLGPDWSVVSGRFPRQMGRTIFRYAQVAIIATTRLRQ